MAQKVKTESAENFVGSVFKFSISTFVNMGILAVAMLVGGNMVPPAVNGQADLFVGWTGTIMTIAILGLDQSLIRFYYEPPAGLSKNGLFRVCFYFSSVVVLIGGALCSTLLMRPIYNAIGFSMVGYEAVPLLFLNAFFYMVARYFNVLYRMEMNVAVYTVESILMQFFFKLFYYVGALFENQAFAMMLCSLVGLGGFALVFSFMRRGALRPAVAEFKSGAYRTVLPYGLAVAPTAVFVTLNAQIPKSYIAGVLGDELLGMYTFSYQLSNIVSLVQGGFAAFWGAYMFEHYKTQQARIQKVHDFLNFIILVFFALLVAFQEVVFFFFQKYTGTQSQAIFPLMMLGAVFTILCEGTVYGNAICKRPIFDTIGIGLSLVTNIVGCLALVPLFGAERGLFGAAIAVALANLVMFLFRTATAQKLYRTIRYPAKTAAAMLLAVALAVAGTLLADHFVAKGLCSLAAIGIYCLLYRGELVRCVNLGLDILRQIAARFSGKKGN